MAVDMNQVAAFRAQVQQIEFNQNLASQQLMTQQSAIALDAAKFIIETSSRTSDTPPIAIFSDAEIRHAYEAVARIAQIFTPQIQPPPIPERTAAA